MSIDNLRITKHGMPDRFEQMGYPSVFLDRPVEWNVVDQAVKDRMDDPEFNGGVINFYGDPEVGKSALVKGVIIPNLTKRYPNIPIVHVDFGDSWEKYGALDGKTQFIIDIDEKLAQVTGEPVVDLLAEKGKRMEALTDWMRATLTLQSFDWNSGVDDVYILATLGSREAELVSGFKEYTRRLAEKRRKTVVFVLDSTDQILNTRGVADRDFLRLLQEELILHTTDTGLYVWVVSGRKPFELSDRRMESRYQWHELEMPVL